MKKCQPMHFSEVVDPAHTPKNVLDWRVLGPTKRVCNSATSNHACVTHMVYLGSQNNPCKCLLPTRQHTANQNELKHSSTHDFCDVMQEINSFLLNVWLSSYGGEGVHFQKMYLFFCNTLSVHMEKSRVQYWFLKYIIFFFYFWFSQHRKVILLIIMIMIIHVILCISVTQSN